MTDGARRVFGDPVVTANGDTVVPVSAHGLFGTTRPVGVFVVGAHGATWVPVTDRTRILLLAEAIGLVAATVATLAMLRRPPWPDLTPAGLDALGRVLKARKSH